MSMCEWSGISKRAVGVECGMIEVAKQTTLRCIGHVERNLQRVDKEGERGKPPVS